jgi:hypothetical protein
MLGVNKKSNVDGLAWEECSVMRLWRSFWSAVKLVNSLGGASNSFDFVQVGLILRDHLCCA